MSLFFALATLTFAPLVTFTSDSVYKNENILTVEVQENYEEDVLVSKDLILSERNMLGYIIYDNPETEYIDGIKFDGEFIYNWTIKNYDDTTEHTLLVKTVYTDDIAGTLAAAKDGNWSRLLSNPLIVFQIGYYFLAAISIILGGFGLLKSKKKKIKTSEEIAAIVTNEAKLSATNLKTEALSLVTDIVTPVFTKLQTQNQAIIEALVLAQSKDKDAKLALINLLKDTATEDVSTVTDTITKAIEEADIAKTKAKEEATKLVNNIANGILEDTSEKTEDTENNSGGVTI